MPKNKYLISLIWNMPYYTHVLNNQENSIYPYGLLGWRSWKIHKEQLVSAVIGQGSWSDSVVEAECLLRLSHSAPNPFCDCGLYAYNSFTEALNNGIRYFDYEPSTTYIHGLVVGAGKMEIHQDGFRAERMQILGLVNNGSPQSEHLADKYDIHLFSDFEQAIDIAFRLQHSGRSLKFLDFQQQINVLADFPFRTSRDFFDKLHSYDDRPAIIYPNGRREWYRHGRLHREEGPAVVEKTDRNHEKHLALRLRKVEEYYKNGIITRENDLPAFTVSSPLEIFSANMWYQQGELHRDEDKPAIISGDIKEWYQRGERHRDVDKGPALYTGPDYYEWWEHGKRAKTYSSIEEAVVAREQMTPREKV